MKKILGILTGICLFSYSFSQIEGKTGVSKFNISKQNSEQKKSDSISKEREMLNIQPEKEKQRPQINWIKPTQKMTETNTEIYQVEICIKSSEPLYSVSIYQNEKIIYETTDFEINFRSDCEYLIIKKINLFLGDNLIKVTALNETGFTVSDLKIVFNPVSGKYYALIIAVQDYLDNQINDLDHPVEDATKLYNLISTEYTFRPEDITFLKNPAKADIIQTLHQFRTKITNQDNLLIFYAGHGYWDEAMQTGYWLPADARKDNPVNWFSNIELRAYIKAIPSRHTLLIADACFSGGIFKTRTAFSEAPASITELIKLPSRKAMTSGTLTSVPDKSVFMEYLIKRLKENKEKYLSAEKLFINFKDAVINNSSVNQIPQYGEIREAGDEGGDFIFIRK